MKPVERWAIETTVAMHRHTLERILAALPNDIERLAAIRGAYHPCSLEQAKTILCAWRSHTGIPDEGTGASNPDAIIVPGEATL